MMTQRPRGADERRFDFEERRAFNFEERRAFGFEERRALGFEDLRALGFEERRFLATGAKRAGAPNSDTNRREVRRDLVVCLFERSLRDVRRTERLRRVMTGVP